MLSNVTYKDRPSEWHSLTTHVLPHAVAMKIKIKKWGEINTANTFTISYNKTILLTYLLYSVTLLTYLTYFTYLLYFIYLLTLLTYFTKLLYLLNLLTLPTYFTLLTYFLTYFTQLLIYLLTLRTYLLTLLTHSLI